MNSVRPMNFFRTTDTTDTTDTTIWKPGLKLQLSYEIVRTTDTTDTTDTTNRSSMQKHLANFTVVDPMYSKSLLLFTLEDEGN